MPDPTAFQRTLRQLIAGELPVKSDFNDFVGHTELVVGMPAGTTSVSR